MSIGRPTKFTHETREKILSAIIRGAPYKIASEMNGVADSTFYSWLDRGYKDLQEGKETDYSCFLEALRAIQFKVISSHLDEIRAAEKGHRGCEWELERSFWKYFSSHAQNIEMNERLETLEKKEKS